MHSHSASGCAAAKISAILASEILSFSTRATLPSRMVRSTRLGRMRKRVGGVAA